MRMKQKTKSIVTALLLGVLCAVTLSAVITVPDWETARADLLIGMQYETTGLDFDAVPGWLAALVMLGFGKAAADKVVKIVARENPGASVEDLVRMSLKRL